MNEAHRRFREWLTGGAEGDPPRDVAVHASVCAECSGWIAALDLLSVVDTGNASMPAEPVGREHSRLVVGVRLVGATAVLFSAAILGVGVSQLIGISHGNGPVAQASATPNQDVLGETATPEASQPSTAPQETLTPLGTSFPTESPSGATPFATPFPYWTYIPTPYPTPFATPFATPTGQPTPGPTATPPPPPPTATPTLAPTATPTPTATPAPPQCSDGMDNDGDGFTDFVGLDPECTDASDNDEAIL